MKFPPWKKSSTKKHEKLPERVIYINEPEKNAEFRYANNYIKTSKYNLINFLPKNLFEQFRRLANFYFLCLVVLQLIPAISSLTPITTIFPLVIVILISAVKDAVDDINRHINDNSVNSRKSLVLHGHNSTDGKKLHEERWDRVEVGDIVRLENDQFVTADLFILSTSEPHGLCYIETAELDGETNLKSRECLPETAELKDDDAAISALQNCRITCEAPNNVLDRFQGQLQWQNGQQFPLTNNQILLRGCALRNTKWCYGVVIFAGRDTKLMQNSGKTVLKRTRVDRLLNLLIVGIVFFLLALCLLATILRSIWELEYGQYFQVYVPWVASASTAQSKATSIMIVSVLVFFSYIILLNTLVPISLYVSIEIIRLIQSFWINWDRQMCHNSNEFAKARTTTLNEELGQIEYVFSDKTGTLTQNIMTLLKMSIVGHVYGDLFDEHGDLIMVPPPNASPGQYKSIDFSKLCPAHADPTFKFYDATLEDAVLKSDEHAHLFFKLLALCHTVMPEDKKGTLVYQAQSPDEGALCKAARNFGFVFIARTPHSITLDVHGEIVTYDILCILDFNNVRKRMSVIVRDPRNGQITLYCKGADSVILERLNPQDPEQQRLKAQTNEHLNQFAAEGLRTLCLAYKPLDAEVYAKWYEEYHEAAISMQDREERMDAVMEKIETNLLLVGATAIEDKLQDGVPQAIATLLESGLRLWVLTGDKQETAINIGYSCNLLTDDMRQVFIVDGETSDEVQQQLTKARDKIVAYESRRPSRQIGNSSILEGVNGGDSSGDELGGAASDINVQQQRGGPSLRLNNNQRYANGDVDGISAVNGGGGGISRIDEVDDEDDAEQYADYDDEIDHVSPHIVNPRRAQQQNGTHRSTPTPTPLSGAMMNGVHKKAAQNGTLPHSAASFTSPIYSINNNNSDGGSHLSSKKGGGRVDRAALESSPHFNELLSADGGYALVVNGSSLKHALEKSLSPLFLRVATQCRTVICCRVTPLQKALVIELVKRRKRAVTLAIGDGANDVGMIKAAHIGVGISGQEGRQAVLASDYSLAQFRFLQRLLLVHGRWSYFRVSKFLRYFFYKNFSFSLCHFWFAFFCGYSAQTVFDPWFVAFYNLFYTSLPVLVIGIFDQDVNDVNSQKRPRLYAEGLRMAFFNKSTFLLTALHGLVTSLVLFFVLFGGFYHDAELYNFQAFSLGIATNLVLIVTIQIAIDTCYWTFWSFFTVIGSVIFYFVFTFIIYSFVWPAHLHSAYAGTWLILYAKPVYWLCMVLTTTICIVPVIAYRFYMFDVHPTLADISRWQQLRNIRLQARVHQFTMARSKNAESRRRPSGGAYSTRRRQHASVRSSYAFSHERGFGRLITSGLNMRDASAGLRYLPGFNMGKSLVKLVAISPRTGTGAATTKTTVQPVETATNSGVFIYPPDFYPGGHKLTATGVLGLHAASMAAVPAMQELTPPIHEDKILQMSPHTHASRKSHHHNSRAPSPLVGSMLSNDESQKYYYHDGQYHRREKPRASSVAAQGASVAHRSVERGGGGSSAARQQSADRQRSTSTAAVRARNASGSPPPPSSTAPTSSHSYAVHADQHQHVSRRITNTISSSTDDDVDLAVGAAGSDMGPYSSSASSSGIKTPAPGTSAAAVSRTSAASSSRKPTSSALSDSGAKFQRAGTSNSNRPREFGVTPIVGGVSSQLSFDSYLDGGGAGGDDGTSPAFYYSNRASANRRPNTEPDANEDGEYKKKSSGHQHRRHHHHGDATRATSATSSRSRGRSGFDDESGAGENVHVHVHRGGRRSTNKVVEHFDDSEDEPQTKL